MGRLLKSTVSFLLLLTMFVSANHCALEEILAQADTRSSCCPVENEEHPHGTPCKELTTTANASIIKFSSPVLPLSSATFFIAHEIKLAENQFLSERLPRIVTTEDYKKLSAHELTLSPNAPPVA